MSKCIYLIMNERTPVLAYRLLSSPCNKSIVFISSRGSPCIILKHTLMNFYEDRRQIDFDCFNSSLIRKTRAVRKLNLVSRNTPWIWMISPIQIFSLIKYQIQVFVQPLHSKPWTHMHRSKKLCNAVTMCPETLLSWQKFFGKFPAYFAGLE